jgi:hypothetical protein
MLITDANAHRWKAQEIRRLDQQQLQRLVVKAVAGEAVSAVQKPPKSAKNREPLPFKRLSMGRKINNLSPCRLVSPKVPARRNREDT